MARHPIDVTDAEFAVLDALWDSGPQTIRALTDRLYPAGSASDYATVQKLLERLEAKRTVSRDRSNHRHIFRAACGREELVGGQLQKVANKLCDGSLTPVLLHLVQSVKLSKSDREVLRKLLDDSDPATAPKARRT